MKILKIIETIWSWIFIIKPYGINIFSILSVNVCMEIIKRSGIRKFIIDELKLWIIKTSISIFLSYIFSLIFILPNFNFLFFIQTSFLTFILSWAFYEIVKSIKPLNILKEFIKKKINK